MTSFLIGLLYVVEVIVCLLLALAVMLQKPKEVGLGGAIGGGMGEAVFGADASNVLIKVTIWLGSIFLVNTLLLARLTSVGHTRSVMGDVSEPPQQQQQPAAAPAPVPAPEAIPAPAATPDGNGTVRVLVPSVWYVALFWKVAMRRQSPQVATVAEKSAASRIPASP